MDTACYIKQKNYLWTLCIETSSSVLWSASSTGWCPSCARAPRCNYFRSPEELRDATTFETSHGTSFLLKSTLLHNGHCLTSLSNTDLRPSGIVDTLQAIKWFFDYFFQNHSRNPFFRNYSVSFNYFFFPFSNINYFFFLVPPYKPVCDSSPFLYGSQCSSSTLQIRALLRTQTRIFSIERFISPSNPLERILPSSSTSWDPSTDLSTEIPTNWFLIYPFFTLDHNSLLLLKISLIWSPQCSIRLCYVLWKCLPH